MAASITAAKFAIPIPNVEIVTLLCALYGFVFGWLGLAAVLVFVVCDIQILGTGTWIVSYLIYWPLVTVTYILLSRLRIKNVPILTTIAVILTLFFGVLTSFVDVGLFAGMYENFWYNFSVYYMRGINFYIAQVVSNIASFGIAFRPLSEAFTRYKKRNSLFVDAQKSVDAQK